MLNSGDMLVFGGPQRLMWHRVRRVILESSPVLDARINLTFRQCSDLSVEQDAYYDTEVYVKRIRDGWATRAAKIKDQM